MEHDRNTVRKDCFSMLRQAQLNWYPFQKGKQALLLGQNKDQILQLLNKHYSWVTFVSVDNALFLEETIGEMKTEIYSDCHLQ